VKIGSDQATGSCDKLPDAARQSQATFTAERKVFICKLRKKLANASGGKDYIETIWGRGYRLREPSGEDAAPIAAAV